MTIVIACDEKYYKKAIQYGLFDSILKNWRSLIFLLCIGFVPINIYNQRILTRGCGLIAIKSFRREWPSNRENFVCAEGEDFNQWFDLPEGELILHLDADMIMQREISETEKLLLESIEEGEVGMSPSANPIVSLREEFYRLKPKLSYEKVNQIFPGNLGTMPLYCTGAIVARNKTYKEISQMYNDRFDDIIKCFDHHAAGQWLFNYIVHNHFVAYDLKSWFHNASWFMDTNTKEENGQLTYNGEVVLFNHTKFNKMYEY